MNEAELLAIRIALNDVGAIRTGLSVIKADLSEVHAANLAAMSSQASLNREVGLTSRQLGSVNGRSLRALGTDAVFARGHILSLGTAIASVTAGVFAFKGAWDLVMASTLAMERKRSFERMLNFNMSKADAQKLGAETLSYSNKQGLDIKESRLGVARLAATKSIPNEDLVPTMRALKGLTLEGGASSDQYNRAFREFSEFAERGHLDNRILRSLGMNLFPYQQLAPYIKDFQKRISAPPGAGGKEVASEYDKLVKKMGEGGKVTLRQLEAAKAADAARQAKKAQAGGQITFKEFDAAMLKWAESAKAQQLLADAAKQPTASLARLHNLVETKLLPLIGQKLAPEFIRATDSVIHWAEALDPKEIEHVMDEVLSFGKVLVDHAPEIAAFGTALFLANKLGLVVMTNSAVKAASALQMLASSAGGAGLGGPRGGGGIATTEREAGAAGAVVAGGLKGPKSEGGQAEGRGFVPYGYRETETGYAPSGKSGVKPPRQGWQMQPGEAGAEAAAAITSVRNQGILDVDKAVAHSAERQAASAAKWERVMTSKPMQVAGSGIKLGGEVAGAYVGGEVASKAAGHFTDNPYVKTGAEIAGALAGWKLAGYVLANPETWLPAAVAGVATKFSYDVYKSAQFQERSRGNRDAMTAKALAKEMGDIGLSRLAPKVPDNIEDQKKRMDDKALADWFKSTLDEHGHANPDIASHDPRKYMDAAESYRRFYVPDSREYRDRVAGDGGRDIAKSARFDAGDSLYAGAMGLFARGNIDLAHRPQHRNEDGSISTVRSMSFEEQGVEILVPTIDKLGKALTDAQAIEEYHKSGQFLGKFDTAEHATVFAQALHEKQAAFYQTVNTIEGSKKSGWLGLDAFRGANADGRVDTPFSKFLQQPPGPNMEPWQIPTRKGFDPVAQRERWSGSRREVAEARAFADGFARSERYGAAKQTGGELNEETLARVVAMALKDALGKGGKWFDGDGGSPYSAQLDRALSNANSRLMRGNS